ncbi:MAG TPA: DUF6582 domain-containing protein [Rhizomicrobium sp.]|nr:DUF6582 domain-containing protein [Rhizomicrobium sp.]
MKRLSAILVAVAIACTFASHSLPARAATDAVSRASGDHGDYGDVAYADPGYQEDGKPRYPIDTEKHVRAAWSYINKQHNQSMYTAGQVAQIKSRIIAAWKRKIEPDGPPSAELRGKE